MKRDWEAVAFIAIVFAVAAIIVVGVIFGDREPDPTMTEIGNGLYTGQVTIDGVKCVIVDGLESVAVSCDWGER